MCRQEASLKIAQILLGERSILAKALHINWFESYIEVQLSDQKEPVFFAKKLYDEAKMGMRWNYNFGESDCLKLDVRHRKEYSKPPTCQN